MPPLPSAEALLAAHLAKPFLLPGQTGQPLSFRGLPDGGMVVIAADGRKLWFTTLEVGRARKQLKQPTVTSPKNNDGPRLHEPDPRHPAVTSGRKAGSRDGKSEMIVLPESLKHIEEEIHARSARYPKPRPRDA
jgi:hypothetical protein